jgi:F-type H+-transporting ATPase subunit a
VTPLATPFLPLEGSEPPTFGVDSFDSRPLFPSEAWLHGDSAHYAWSDIWVTNHIAQAVIAAALVIAFWLWVSHNQKIVPGKKQFMGEYLYDMLRNTVARDILGHDYKTYLPYLVSIFTFVLVNNLFGQFFLFMFPTFSKIGFAWGLALLTWLLYNGVGIKKWGLLVYLKRMTIPQGVPWWLLPMIIPLEILSNFIVRPVTLGLRLFANLFAGHLVILVFVLGGNYLMFVSEPVINKVAGGLAIVLAFGIFALELLVGALQAYIFTVLTAQYVSSAIAEEH